ncbi:MAG: hypothetical protein IAG13_19150 [Deltaproteobacteria bacterium]|nr:hypothetical protein [Nannocystaceae bacterium]
MNDPRQMRGESGLWFSPQPFPPGLVGQRHLDSTLFDLRQLDAAGLQRREQGPLVGTREQPGSGLIDIKTLVGAAQQGDAPARAVVIPPPRGLVAFVPPTATMPVANDSAVRKLLGATCLALLMVALVLAVEALG